MTINEERARLHMVGENRKTGQIGTRDDAEYLIFSAIAAVELLAKMPSFSDNDVLFDSIERLESATRQARQNQMNACQLPQLALL